MVHVLEQRPEQPLDQTHLPYAYFAGQIVPLAQAQVSIATHALQYGTAVFGGIRGYLDADGHTINLFRLHDHCVRFVQSAGLIKLRLPFDAKGLAALACELTRCNAPTTTVYLRPFAYKASFSLVPALRGPDGFALYMQPLDSFYSIAGGLSVMVSSWQRIADRVIPARGKVAGGYINASIAKDEAYDYGFDDAIMLNERGKVSEGSASNIFVVRDGVLITPPVTADILEGITRRSLIQIAHDLGIPVVERELDRTELYVADEIFFCGTGVQVSWIGQIDRRPVGGGCEGPLTARLRERFFAIVQGKVPAYADWLTPVVRQTVPPATAPETAPTLAE